MSERTQRRPVATMAPSRSSRPVWLRMLLAAMVWVAHVPQAWCGVRVKPKRTSGGKHEHFPCARGSRSQCARKTATAVGFFFFLGATRVMGSTGGGLLQASMQHLSTSQHAMPVRQSSTQHPAPSILEHEEDCLGRLHPTMHPRNLPACSTSSAQ